MEAPAKPHSLPDDRDNSGSLLGAFRERARQLLEKQRTRVVAVEADLSAQIESLLEQLQAAESGGPDRAAELATLVQANHQLRDELGQALKARRELESLLEEARVAISEASSDQNELRAQLAQCQKKLEARAEELTELRNRLAGPAGDGAGPENADSSDQVPLLRSECDELRAERDELQSLLENLDQRDPAGGQADEQLLDDLRQRFELAVQEVRELKTRNGELASQLAAAGDRTPAVPEAGEFDWELQKRRMMLQLEADFDDADSQQANDKLTVEGAIRITDQVVADKENEIQELKRRLNEQSIGLGNGDAGAAVIAEALDQDELIRRERESLRQLQEELRAKLRAAEIDISVERAKLARDRSDLQEKLEAFEEDHARYLESATENATGKASQKTRGRWLARLGLKDDLP